jgi:hypothetical protein
MRRIVQSTAPLVSAVAVLIIARFPLAPEASPQDSDPTSTAYVFRTILTFQVPGDSRTPGEQQTATGIATVRPEPTPTFSNVGVEGGKTVTLRLEAPDWQDR